MRASMASRVGPAVMLLSAILFSGMNLFAKAASLGLPSAQVTFARFAFGWALIGMLGRAGAIRLHSDNRRLLIARGVFGGIAIILFFAAMSLGRLTNASLLSSTYMIFGTIFSVFYLKERLRAGTLAAVVVSFIGMYLVIQPDFHHIRWGDALGLISGVFGGAAIVFVRELRRTESSWTILYYLCMIGSLFAGLLLFGGAKIPGRLDVFLLLMVGITGTTAQLLMTYAFRFCRTAEGGILSMSSVVFTAVAAHFVFQEPFTLALVLGGLLVLGSCAYLMLAVRE